MNTLVQLPYWLVVIGAILAAIAVLDRMLMPSVRWYLRRRFNRAIEKLNDRLQLRIQPFKLTARRVMIDRLTHDPQVMEAVDAHATEENMPREIAAGKAETYAREIVPAFSAGAYFGVGIRIARFISQSLYRVRLGFIDEDALRKVDTDSTIIFVMNHRSNMDYVLVTFLAAQRTALSYAVGEWARVWPLQRLIRSMGAYFIRRKSRNQLYRRVLSRYVQMATEGGVSQAVFPEGGLSLDGRLAPPKLGILSYVLAGFNPEATRDVVFIPVGLNYDRVLEDRVLSTVDTEGKRVFKFSIGVMLRFVSKQIWLRMTGKYYRYGYACVSFGNPVSLREFVEKEGGAPSRAATEVFGNHLMEKVGEVVPVLPVPLVATVMLEASGPMTMLDIKSACHAKLATLRAGNAFIYLPHKDEDYAIEVGLRMLVSRHLVVDEDGLFRLAQTEIALVQFYANSISHLDGGHVKDDLAIESAN